MARSSKIIIAKNIKLDKEYKEVLNYSEQDMLTLVNSNKVAESSSYSFIRDKGTIMVNFSYSDCLKCNYMAFQNTDYESKWFFAFINDVKYINNGTTEIEYTVDSWSTWYSKLNVSSAFVIREHVSDDTVGLHTLPESLETGEYIINSLGNIDDEDYSMINCLIVMGVSWTPDNIPNYSGDRKYGGVYSGLYYYAFSDATSCSKMCKAYDDLAKADAIFTIFLAPRSLIDVTQWYTFNLGNQEDIVAGFPNSSVYSTSMVSNFQLSSPTTLNGYTPKNNKLKCNIYLKLEKYNKESFVKEAKAGIAMVSGLAYNYGKPQTDISVDIAGVMVEEGKVVASQIDAIVYPLTVSLTDGITPNTTQKYFQNGKLTSKNTLGDKYAIIGIGAIICKNNNCIYYDKWIDSHRI